LYIVNPNRKKMKKIYLFLFLVACGSLGFAQPFSVTPGPVANMDIPEGTMGEAYIYFNNQTSNSLTLVWTLTETTLDTNWAVSICDNRLCYFSAHPGSTMDPITGGQNAFLKFDCTVHPGEAGTGHLSYRVQASEGDTTSVVITYNVNGIVSVSPSSFANQVNISPNPASSVLTMSATTGSLAKGEVQIYDLAGRMLREVTVKGIDVLDIDVQTLPQGSYLLRYLSDEGLVTRRFLKTN
jgi:hypothetical protein